MTDTPTDSERLLRACVPEMYGVKPDEYPIDFRRSIGSEFIVRRHTEDRTVLYVSGFSARRDRFRDGAACLTPWGEYVLRNVKHTRDPYDMWLAYAVRSDVDQRHQLRLRQLRVVRIASVVLVASLALLWFLQ